MDKQRPAVVGESGRRFDCVPAAVLVFIIDDAERFLLLRHPQRSRWEVVNGALDAGETVLAAAQREVGEEAGPAARARLLGPLHIQSFHYDAQVQFMLSLCFVAAYEGGAIAPGDDMTGSDVGWFDLETVSAPDFPFFLPRQRWLFKRAIQLYRLWRDDAPDLQPSLDDAPPNKYQQMALEAEQRGNDE